MKNTVLILIFLCAIGYSQPEYTYIQVDPPEQPAAAGVSFYAINDSGVVAARAYGTQTKRWHVLRWSEEDGYSFAYDAPTSDIAVDPTSINNLGTITALRYASGNLGIIILNNGTTYTLPFTSGQSSQAYDSNILDQVVGRSLGSAVLWENGNINNITNGTAFAINDSGDIALVVPTGGRLQTVLRYANETNAILNFPVDYGTPYSLNNNREIVGQYNQNGSVAFYWSAQTGVVNLPGLPGFPSTAAVAINDSGIIVGYAVNPGDPSRAVVWYKNNLGFYVIKDINDYVPVGFGEARWAEDINNAGVIAGTIQTGSGARGYLLKPPEFFEVTKPAAYAKWIAGETDTIKWTGGQLGQFLQIELSTDNGANYEILDFGIPADSGYYIWQLSDNILTTKAKIKLTDMVSPGIKSESGTFRIKPYLLTRLNSDSTYYEYRKDRDQWGFSNIQPDVWPATWYNQFNYRGIDPYTQIFYPRNVLDSLFYKAKSQHHPDWLAFVRTFGISDCYADLNFGIYKQNALLRWKASKDTSWGGSCFGIAAANALAFSYRTQFTEAFPTFPVFVNPVSADSNNGVRFVVNELFSHQFGNPSKANDVVGNAKTPNQTLNDIKQMLLDDNSIPRTLTIFNNNDSGGHTILAYGLKQDPIQKNLYYVQVYDNSNPTSNNPITIDTLANGGTGSWNTPDWINPPPNGLPWGGTTGIYLEIPAQQYLNGASFSKQSNQQSAFIIPENILEINNSRTSQIRIVDGTGNVSGYVNSSLLNGIPGSIPLMIKNGSVGPPYGYNLQADNYSVVLNQFEEDTVNTFFFTGNKSFMYERSGAEQIQTDRLFFDGGVSVSNPDVQSKKVKLLNLVNETTREKLTIMRSIDLVQNDSVKIENPDNNKIKLISYGSAKEYDIELNYVTQSGIGRFGDFNIQLSENTSHTLVPDWSNITNTELMVLVDTGNNGSIDDTLYLQNQVTGIGDDQGSLLTPDKYNLAQNYPNPFNPTTTISFSLPEAGFVRLNVYNLLGEIVETLVNESRNAGIYESTFDAKNLPSGIYIYRIEAAPISGQAGNFTSSGKMILMK